MSMSSSQYKLKQLEQFVDQVCVPESCVQAVIAVGSVAVGQAEPESDIDAIVFMDPLDLYAVPAEAVWFPYGGSFHGIFSPEASHPGGIQLDLLRLDLRKWQEPAFEWPEQRLAELASGRLVFDRQGAVDALVRERTHYSDHAQQRKLDEAITWLDQLLTDDICTVTWERFGSEVAIDRLNSTYDWLVQALFALNRHWRPWRNREMNTLLELPWLPDKFKEHLLVAMAGAGHDRAGYDARAKTLGILFRLVLAHALELNIYKQDPIGEAFIRSHDEPGRDWNMAEWVERRAFRRSNGT